MLREIYLIRHGETEWSRTGRHTSRTDIALTPHGEEMSRELGRQLRGVEFVRVLTSPRLRARQTCTLAGLGATAAVEADLAEWDYGDYEGKQAAEILGSRPEWNLFRDGCPHGATPAEVSDRADRLLGRLRGRDGKVALFTHAHFARVLGVRWIGLPVIEAQHFLLEAASCSVLGYEHERADEPAIVRWNLTAK